jgi:galactokinase
LAATAWKTEGILGARMMGGGFGGCTINLVKSSAIRSFEEEIEFAYSERFGITPEFIPVRIGNGASLVSPSSQGS